MNLYLFNTETNDRIILQTVPLDADLGGLQSRYVAADIPQKSFSPLYYQGTETKSRQVRAIFDGPNTSATIEQLRSWARPAKGKSAPAILIYQLGSLTPVRCVMTEISVSAPLARFSVSEKPTRAAVTMALSEVSQPWQF